MSTPIKYTFEMKHDHRIVDGMTIRENIEVKIYKEQEIQDVDRIGRSGIGIDKRLVDMVDIPVAAGRAFIEALDAKLKRIGR